MLAQNKMWNGRFIGAILLSRADVSLQKKLGD